MNINENVINRSIIRGANYCDISYSSCPICVNQLQLSYFSFTVFLAYSVSCWWPIKIYMFPSVTQFGHALSIMNRFDVKRHGLSFAMMSSKDIIRDIDKLFIDIHIRWIYITFFLQLKNKYFILLNIFRSIAFEIWLSITLCMYLRLGFLVFPLHHLSS